jgi:hypothetical protein
MENTSEPRGQFLEKKRKLMEQEAGFAHHIDKSRESGP